MAKKHPLEVFHRMVNRDDAASRRTPPRDTTRRPKPKKPREVPPGDWRRAFSQLLESPRIRILLLGLGGGLALALSVALGYKWGFSSGQAKSLDEGLVAGGGFGSETSLEARSMWKPAGAREETPSDGKPSDGKQGDGEESDPPLRESTKREIVWSVRLAAYAETKLDLAETWRARLIAERVEDVLIFQDAEGHYLLCCGRAAQKEELDALLERMKKYRDKQDRPFESAMIVPLEIGPGSR